MSGLGTKIFLFHSLSTNPPILFISNIIYAHTRWIFKSATCAVFGVVMVPVWTTASNIVKKTLKAREVPILAVGAAFSFVVMMFNIPIPGGSRDMGWEAVLLAILWGRGRQCIAVFCGSRDAGAALATGGLRLWGKLVNMAFVYVCRIYTYRLIGTGSTRDRTDG